MQKTEALAAMGQKNLLLPAWIKAALAANDRLKVYLSVLQCAAAHAEHPEADQMNLENELAATGLNLPWLSEMPASAALLDGVFVLPDCERLMRSVAVDLQQMARPLTKHEHQDVTLLERVQQRLKWLDEFHGERLTPAQLQALASGDRAVDRESLHVLVMDLHRCINQLAKDLSNEEIDGAHVWQLQPEDRPRVAAFMRGVNRTTPLKFDHPGLDTAATREDGYLAIQNDIGENDVHVLVLKIKDLTVTVTYADLHRERFEFFQAMLEPFHAQWTGVGTRVEATLNAGKAFTFGTGRFECEAESELEATLEAIGSRIVFLIDWNRARKRLLPFVSKRAAISILSDAAQSDHGHMAWLKAGGEALIFEAMQSAGPGAFRIGDRLDSVLGEADAHAFLVEVMRIASKTLRRAQPMALVADETRLLLAKRVRQHSNQFDLLDEHAGYCHALAQAVCDGMMLDVAGSPDAARELAARAKVWERRADHLVMQAREQGKRQPGWRPFGNLIALSDDVADALEEAAFLMSLIADGHRQGWSAEVRDALWQLADTVLFATQEHVKSLAIARSLSATSEARDSDAFLSASWNVLRSERKCDELLRAGRRIILTAVTEAPALMLANDLAMTLELASDRLLVAGYALRDVAFSLTEVTP